MRKTYSLYEAKAKLFRGPRMEQLLERGIVVRNPRPARAARRVIKRAGSLKRFLDDRDR
jgi:hypothetical protein